MTIMNSLKILLILLFIHNPASAVAPWLENINHPLKQQQIDLRWHADGGEFAVHFEQELLKELGINLTNLPKGRMNIDSNSYSILNIRNTSSLSIQAPFGILQGIPSGQLQLSDSFSWSRNDTHINFENLVINSSPEKLNAGEIASLDISNQSGEVLFHLSNIHTNLDINNNQLKMMRMDVRVSTWLAKKLGIPHIDNWVVAQAEMYNNLTVPAEYLAIKGTPTCPVGRPLWPDENNEADVALINMTWSYRRRIDVDHVVLTPDATLKNIGEADVAWQGKFTGDFPPYNTAQHPYLNWSMYREIDNRFEQIGLSDIKHAFYTVNTNCTIDCGDHHILYKGCEDIYTVSNNDGGAYLGPREELEAFSAEWEEVGSFFDQDGNGVQDNQSNSTDENRMIVSETSFSNPLYDYYFSSWYVIRDDANIFNSMGFRKYELDLNQQTNTWSFNNPSPFTNGPASDAYLPPNTTANDLMSASHRSLQTDEGHLTAAVKVIDLGNGMYRYNYMIENHDYDPRVEQIEISMPDWASFSDFIWSDRDNDTNNDWSIQRINNTLILSSVNNNNMDWGMLFSFSFTTNTSPELGDITLQGHENAQSRFNMTSLQPQIDDLIFEDSFDALMP